MTTLDQAIAQMRAAGMPDFPPGHPKVNTDRIQRYGPKKKAWYRLFEYRARNNRYYIAGGYGVWGELESQRIESDWEGVAPDERERIERSQAELKRQEEAKRAQKALFASRRADDRWKQGVSVKPAGVETYLDRKGVRHEKGLKYFGDGTVLVPMLRYDVSVEQESAEGYTGPRRMVGLQKISPDGTKRFNKGVGMEGAACRLGDAPKSGELVLLTEGVATGLTLRMATDGRHPVFVGFNAGNLPAVAGILRKRFPLSPMLFCADDDAYLVSSLNKLLRENFGVTELVGPPLTECGITTKHGPGLVSADWVSDGDGVPAIVGAMRYTDRVYTLSRQNAGRVYAQRAAKAAGNAAVVYPAFADRKLPAEPDIAGKLTDYNDLHKAEGLDVVRRQLAGELERLLLSIQVRQIMRDEQKRKAGEPKPPKPPKPPPAQPHDFEGFSRRFVLIYPTTTLWDAEYRQIVPMVGVEKMFGKRYLEYWLQSPERRSVTKEQVVFDPTERCADDCINLYNGMATKPDAGGKCDLLLRTIAYLCDEEDSDQAPITEWVLNWMAYPLQHPGAKMHTSIVMHGAEGTGKNMVWGAVRDIYGEYGALITQNELEEKFNGWMSRRLFVIANEVLSHAEKRHQVGRLKTYITESPIPIREMWMPIRYEANHVNAVFLTNETQPLIVSPGDRRYTIIRTPGPKPDQYYAELAAELSAGGAAALHHYLLERELGAFGPDTKPPMTEAKKDLIELSLNSAEWFQQQLHDGLVWPLRYMSCLVRDLYEAYKRHCAHIGERMPRSMKQFSAEFARMNGVRKKVVDVDVDAPPATLLKLSRESAKRRQATVFIMGAWPQDLDVTDETARSAYLQRCFKEFRQDLLTYLEHDDFRVAGAEREERDGARR